MTPRSRPARAATSLAVTTIAVLAFAGCSSSSKSSSSTVAPAVSTAAPAGSTAAPAGSTAATTAPSTAGSTAGSTAAAGGAVLTIKDFAFSSLSGAAGSMVTLTNADTADHTVTADDGSFDVAVSAGKSESLTLPKAGTYAIHCKIHASMKGTITVTG